jgi:Flp pilus assembly protein TadB
MGAVAGVAAGVGAWFGLAKIEPAARVRERERALAMLPLAADLLAAAIGAGCPPVNAVEQVGHALGGPLGRTLATAASAARIGSDPARAWSVLSEDPALKPLGRALASAVVRGVSPVQALERAAQDGRESARWAAESRARSVGARAAAPLGLCFLPAFVLLGIVPVVVSSGVALP